MNDTDQRHDTALLRELRDCLSGITAPEAPPLESIAARGRAHQRHRLSGIAGLSVAAAAAGAALVLALTGVLGSAPSGGTGTIRTAAFVLVRNANGTATLTIDPNVLFEPATLQNDLAQYGIPAKVTSGSFCSSDPAPADVSEVMLPGLRGDGGSPPGPDATVTIDPAAMPSGAELSFGTFQVSTGLETTIALIDPSSYTCTSTAPTTLPPSGALLLYGQPTSS